MTVPEKKNEEVYLPIPDDESSQLASEHDDLIDDELWSSSRKRVPSQRSKALTALVRSFAILAYSLILISATSIWWKRKSLHGPTVIETPLRPFMHYEPTFFRQMDSMDDYFLMGQPSHELDVAWEEIMQYFFTEVPHEYVERLGRVDETSVRLENGNYVAVYAVMHQLHCLKRIHHSYFPEYYFPNMTQEESVLMQEHNLHCLEMLVEGVMCKADEAPLTMRWLENSPLPTGNRTIAHECVNWDSLMSELKRKRVDPFEPGVFVHPKFGPVTPNGRNTVLDNRIGFTPNAQPLNVSDLH